MANNKNKNSIGEYILSLLEGIWIDAKGFASADQRTLAYSLCEQQIGHNGPTAFRTEKNVRGYLRHAQVGDVIDLILWSWSTLSWEDTACVLRTACYILNDFSRRKNVGDIAVDPTMGNLALHTLLKTFGMYDNEIYSCDETSFELCRKHILFQCSKRGYKANLDSIHWMSYSYNSTDVSRNAKEPLRHPLHWKLPYLWTYRPEEDPPFQCKDRNANNLLKDGTVGGKVAALVLFGIVRHQEAVDSLLGASVSERAKLLGLITKKNSEYITSKNGQMSGQHASQHGSSTSASLTESAGEGSRNPRSSSSTSAEGTGRQHGSVGSSSKSPAGHKDSGSETEHQKERHVAQEVTS